jgi:nickel/cobalt transporter (NicO) family protein
MDANLLALLGSAATLGITHTAIGIDHFLPFIVLGRARRWSLPRALLVTGACAVGHVLSSVLIGWVAYWGIGMALERVAGIEEARGQWAAWALMALGVAYMAFGVWRLRSGRRHQHLHVHPDGTFHRHPHTHEHVHGEGSVVHRHAHSHARTVGSALQPVHAVGRAHQSVLASAPRLRAQRPSLARSGRLVPALFVVFVLGPCEPLIPLMAVGAVGAVPWMPALIALAFGGATLLTMLTLVTVGYWGLNANWAERLGPHLDWMAGAALLLTGLGVEFLGI